MIRMNKVSVNIEHNSTQGWVQNGCLFGLFVVPCQRDNLVFFWPVFVILLTRHLGYKTHKALNKCLLTHIISCSGTERGFDV